MGLGIAMSEFGADMGWCTHYPWIDGGFRLSIELWDKFQALEAGNHMAVGRLGIVWDIPSNCGIPLVEYLQISSAAGALRLPLGSVLGGDTPLLSGEVPRRTSLGRRGNCLAQLVGRRNHVTVSGGLVPAGKGGNFV